MTNSLRIGGLLLKSSPDHADVFVKNWARKKKPQAFCIFDRVPVLSPGSPVFTYINTRKHVGIVAQFLSSEIVRGFKKLESDITRMMERERIWATYHDFQLHTRDKEDFDRFWERESGVRSLALIENLDTPITPVPWGDLQKVIYTGYPRGVGYLYLLEEECRVLASLCFGTRELDDRPTSQVARSCYAESIRIIPRILGERPMTTSELYDVVAEEAPELCDDSIECVHEGRAYGQPEWKHELRSAQQALKRARIIERESMSGTWQLTK